MAETATRSRPLALITGASSGIGLELAKQFAEHDYDLVIAAEDGGVVAAAEQPAATGVPEILPLLTDGDPFGTERFATHHLPRKRREDRPLGGYLTVMAVFAALLATAAGLAVATGRNLPREPRPWDVALLPLGTHKLSRTLTKDAVTSPLRAPFTRYTSSGGPAEVMEEPRKDSGLRHALGELMSCPFCLDMWVATGFTIGLVFAPRATRLIAGTFAVLAGADLLQLVYARAQQEA